MINLECKRCGEFELFPQIPSIIPSKPKIFQFQHQHGQTAKFGQFSKNATGVQLPLAPGDSDTDSGICADSENQLSPRHINVEVLDNKLKKLQREFESVVYHENLTPENSWKVHTNLLAFSNQKRLPEGPKTDCHNSSTSRSGKQHRVRFADQVSSTKGDPSYSLSNWDNTDLASIHNCGTNYSDCNLYRPMMKAAITTSIMSTKKSNQVLQAVLKSSNSGIINELLVPEDQINFGHSSHPESKHQINGFASAPLPQSSPGYTMDITRLRCNDNQRLTNSKDQSFLIMRCFHSRSTSLPRSALELRRGTINYSFPMNDYMKTKSDAHYPVVARRTTPENETITNAHLMRNNLSITGRVHDSFTSNPRLGCRRRLPDLPSYNATCNSNVQESDFARKIRRASTNRRSQSVSRVFNSKIGDKYMNGHIPLFHRSHLPAVKAELVALDHRGLRIVLIEKLQSGPFGFYIATGILNQKRGLFISRISLPSLTPVLSVGDEIIYVEGELVKGENLEYVQTLIAGKTRVMIVLLPTIKPIAY